MVFTLKNNFINGNDLDNLVMPVLNCMEEKQMFGEYSDSHVVELSIKKEQEGEEGIYIRLYGVY